MKFEQHVKRSFTIKNYEANTDIKFIYRKKYLNNFLYNVQNSEKMQHT